MYNFFKLTFSFFSFLKKNKKQKSVPVGQVSCLELPAGMIDSINDGIAGTAAKELEEECGIKLKASELTDLTALACQEAIQGSNLPCAGISPSPGGCDEFVRYMYVERQVSAADLEQMKGKLTGLNDHGEYITLRIVPMENMWKVSCDNKVICALFLAEQLRKEGKLPAVGGGLLLSPKPSTEPTYSLPNGDTVPALAFGLYKVPVTKEGGQILADAISNGYRHFDTASLYGNEQILGEAIRKSGIPREEFFVCSKVWNDAQKQGRGAVRESIENSLLHLNLGSLDCAYIHWPVPGHFVETYKELQVLHEEGKIRNIGLSNFGIPEYEELMNSESITIQPVINQIEVSPFMYRPATIQYFQERNILVAASKALHRASGIDVGIVKSIADTHRVTPAQVLVRYSLQKGLVPIVKTSVVQRMIENRDVMNFEITEEEMKSLDALTSKDDIINREELEVQRRCGV